METGFKVNLFLSSLDTEQFAVIERGETFPRFRGFHTRRSFVQLIDLTALFHGDDFTGAVSGFVFGLGQGDEG
jgi:hypothetical protein